VAIIWAARTVGSGGIRFPDFQIDKSSLNATPAFAVPLGFGQFPEYFGVGLYGWKFGNHLEVDPTKNDELVLRLR